MRTFYVCAGFGVSGLVTVTCVGKTRVLCAADRGGKDPEGEDAKGGAEREVDKREDCEDDGEDATPGLACDEGIAGERSAGNAEDQRRKSQWPKSSEEGVMEWTPAEVEVSVREMVAEDAVQEEHANQSGECTQCGVDEPKDAESLQVAAHAGVGGKNCGAGVGISRIRGAGEASGRLCRNGDAGAAVWAKVGVVRESGVTCGTYHGEPLRWDQPGNLWPGCSFAYRSRYVDSVRLVPMKAVCGGRSSWNLEWIDAVDV
jgi:hypothetical protein